MSGLQECLKEYFSDVVVKNARKLQCWDDSIPQPSSSEADTWDKFGNILYDKIYGLQPKEV